MMSNILLLKQTLKQRQNKQNIVVDNLYSKKYSKKRFIILPKKVNTLPSPIVLIAPDIVVPDIVVPDIVVPDIVVPDIVVPDIVVPDIVVPDIVVPDIVVPDIVVPGPKIKFTLQYIKQKMKDNLL
jgi:hypothetical protein